MQLSLIFLFLALSFYALYPGDLHAGEDKSIADDKNSQEMNSDEFMTLLEFLGEWETEQGKFVDPEKLDQMPLKNEDKKNEQKN